MFGSNTSPSDEARNIECEVESFSAVTVSPPPLRSNMRNYSRRGSKSVSYGTVEQVTIDDEEPVAAESSRVAELESKVDLLMEKMDTLLEKLHK